MSPANPTTRAPRPPRLASSRRWTRLVFCVLSLLVWGGQARAEHRVALLIGNAAGRDETSATPPRNLPALATSLLEQHGFNCHVAENLDEQQLKRAVEEFAATTPVRGTALIYFNGQVLPGSYNGRSTLCLLGTNSAKGRGYGLDALLDELNTKGGSWRQLVVLDCPTSPTQKIEVPTELPTGCLVAQAPADCLQRAGDLIAAIKSGATSLRMGLDDDVTIAGRGSMAVSPPDKFVLGKRAGDEWVNSRGMVFCWCPPGSFTAGSPVGTPGRYADEEPLPVVIEEGFWISKYEVTRGHWIGNMPRGCLGDHKLHPINMASQSKDTLARAIDPLNKTEWEEGRLPQDWQYSLPTEQQWEYAARAGTSTRFYFDDDLELLPRHANFADKSFYDTGDIFSNAAHRTLDDGVARLAKVGSYQANPWGLHDVYGNVAEWCAGAAVRGGAWVSAAENCRSAYRDRRGDRDQLDYIGSRWVIQKRADQETD